MWLKFSDGASQKLHKSLGLKPILCNFVLELGLGLQFLFFQMIAHLLRCHLCMEPFAVASWRQLPSLHPVWKLLKPHIVGIIAINTLGREKLISPGGLADRLLSIGGGGLFVHSSIHPFTHLFALSFVHSFNHFIISYHLVVCNEVFFKKKYSWAPKTDTKWIFQSN